MIMMITPNDDDDCPLFIGGKVCYGFLLLLFRFVEHYYHQPTKPSQKWINKILRNSENNDDEWQDLWVWVIFFFSVFVFTMFCHGRKIKNTHRCSDDKVKEDDIQHRLANRPKFICEQSFSLYQIFLSIYLSI